MKKGGKKINPTENNQKKARVAILILDKANFTTKNLPKIKRTFHNNKELIHQEDIWPQVFMYWLIELQNTWRKLIEQKNWTNTKLYLEIPALFSIIYRTIKQKSVRIWKIWIILSTNLSWDKVHSTQRKFFLHILGHKTDLNIRTEIKQYFSVHSEIKSNQKNPQILGTWTTHS